MKKTLALILLGSLMVCSASASTFITSFGTGDFNVSTGFSEFDEQTASGYRMLGDDLGSTFWGELPSVIDIGENTSVLLLVGTLRGSSPESALQLSLIDTMGAEARYEANFSAFQIGAVATVEFAPVHFDFLFNNQVQSLGFMTSGLGAPVDLTVNSLTAAPEPGSGVLLALGLIGMALLKRKR